MADLQQQESIAAGWNVSLGSLVNIATITPAGDEQFAPPKSLPLYDDGLVKIDGDGNIKLLGYASTSWMFTRLTYAQYWYLKNTYCSGGLSGPVTILTSVAGNVTTTWTRLNAIMILKKPKEQRSEYRYQDVEVLFTRLRTAS